MTKREYLIKNIDRIIFTFCLMANCDCCKLKGLGCCIGGNTDSLDEEVKK